MPFIAIVLLALTLAPPGGGSSPPTAPPVGGGGVTAVVAVRPVEGALARHFDPPAVPYGPGHRGVDLAAPAGTQVRTALPGRVSFAGQVARIGWVTVDHGDGLQTTYGPLDPILVRAGQRVGAGDLIGQVAQGNERLDWGARLDGRYIDPLGLLRPWRAWLTAP